MIIYLRRSFVYSSVMLSCNQKETLLQNDVTDFQNHPTLNDELLKTDKLNIQTITARQYDSYFGKKPKRNEKAWKKVLKKYGTKQIIGFSKINYYKNFATLYYERHCGQLCGSGNMVVFEKIKGKWIILSEINFWMS